ncbi:phage holin family protein [Caballeronia sp. GAWG1-1]|uniref:phage holin family protein n=1 Tax=Caballeronia sp. GAWG1-1 TaxID=2921742 RepID=UPI00202850BC|nr:phage holin family protein [Caballeronia sp. GAWG1-1]
MSIHPKITRWRNVGQFCCGRVADYSALFLVELAQTKAKMMRELIAMVALAVGVLFTLSFLCFAVIATAWQTPYFLAVVWGIAGLWLLISIVAFLVLRAQKPVESFKTLQSEIQDDMAAIKEALK